jgi:hypothetical protein
MASATCPATPLNAGPTAATATVRLVPDAEARLHILRPGGGGAGTDWLRPPGVEFFTAPADFIDPIQGVIPDCHFISALAALAWNPATQV